MQGCTRLVRSLFSLTICYIESILITIAIPVLLILMSRFMMSRYSYQRFSPLRNPGILVCFYYVVFTFISFDASAILSLKLLYVAFVNKANSLPNIIISRLRLNGKFGFYMYVLSSSPPRIRCSSELCVCINFTFLLYVFEYKE